MKHYNWVTFLLGAMTILSRLLFSLGRGFLDNTGLSNTFGVAPGLAKSVTSVDDDLVPLETVKVN